HTEVPVKLLPFHADRCLRLRVSYLLDAVIAIGSLFLFLLGERTCSTTVLSCVPDLVQIGLIFLHASFTSLQLLVLGWHSGWANPSVRLRIFLDVTSVALCAAALATSDAQFGIRAVQVGSMLYLLLLLGRLPGVGYTLKTFAAV
ncbi:unnamed protein product, partial [Chrysoparadoxa australica]